MRTTGIDFKFPQSTSNEEEPLSASLVKSSVESSPTEAPTVNCTSHCNNCTKNATMAQTYCAADLSCNPHHTCYTKNCTEAITFSLVNCTDCSQRTGEFITVTLKLPVPPPNGTCHVEITRKEVTHCTELTH